MPNNAQQKKATFFEQRYHACCVGQKLATSQRNEENNFPWIELVHMWRHKHIHGKNNGERRRALRLRFARKDNAIEIYSNSWVSLLNNWIWFELNRWKRQNFLANNWKPHKIFSIQKNHAVVLLVFNFRQKVSSSGRTRLWRSWTYKMKYFLRMR